MSEIVFSLRGLSKRYKRNTALRDIDFDIKGSEITGIIGPDGAGKSTLLKICAGVLGYDGEAKYRGREIGRDPEFLKRGLSFMPQGIGQNLYMELTVDENIDFFASLKSVPAEVLAERKERLLEATALKPFRRRLARDLSGGMKQKLGICCSLVSEPEVLILDEPSTGVDPLSRRQLWQMLNEYLLSSETTILIGTSYMDEAERCHAVMFLHNAVALYRGHPEELMENGQTVEDAFFRMLIERTEAVPEPSLPPDARQCPDSGELIIQGLSKSFGQFKAVDNVSLQLKRGEVLGLLGPNGAGKTTLIKCMVGLLRPDSGRVELMGMKLGSAELKKRIGYMSQLFSLYNDLTVKENIELYGYIYGLKPALLKRRLEWIVEFSQLQAYLDTQVKSLPGGMKQRLALGCATLHLPDILILDEPTSGVDPLARGLFWDFIRMLSRQLCITVIVTTHNLVEADYCDRVAIMNEGRVIALSPPERLREEFVKSHGHVYEVYPSVEIKEDIFKREGISAVPFGRRYHLWQKGLNEDRIARLLEQNRIGYHYIRRIVPPMEDVFIYKLSEDNEKDH